MRTEEDFNKLSMEDHLDEIIWEANIDSTGGASYESILLITSFRKRLKELEEKAWMYDQLNK